MRFDPFFVALKIGDQYIFRRITHFVTLDCWLNSMYRLLSINERDYVENFSKLRYEKSLLRITCIKSISFVCISLTMMKSLSLKTFLITDESYIVPMYMAWLYGDYNDLRFHWSTRAHRSSWVSSLLRRSSYCNYEYCLYTRVWGNERVGEPSPSDGSKRKPIPFCQVYENHYTFDYNL